MASYEETLVSITLDAHPDIVVDTAPPNIAPGFQYRFVHVTGDHQCNLFNGTTVGDIPVGVLQSKPQVEEMACTVGISGISLIEAGGNVSAGDGVGADATGRAITDGTLGIAIYGGAEGELIPVLLRLTATPTPA